ncbi:hypothetical protein ACW9KT_10330 [Hymenobacter sp. HD11105]
MKEVIKWSLWIIVAITMMQQENLYFETICEFKFGSINIWEINRLLPALLLFGILICFYGLMLKYIYECEISKKYLNAYSLGILALLSSVSISIPLYINKELASSRKIKVVCTITYYEMMSGGKHSKSYPSIFINVGNPNKRLSLNGYDKGYVYSKKQAVLTLQKGYFGWPIITKIHLQ